jgi:hypothetical protein
MRRRLAALGLGGWFVLALSTASAQQAGSGLAALMQSMARVRSASASFSESKTLPMLTAPLLANGTLDYVAPDYIRKRTTAPVPEDFILQRDEITLTGGPGGQTHRFSMADDPEIGGLAEGIRATLAGDLPALEQIYVVAFSGSQAGWQLVLKPKDPRLEHFIAWIAFRGSGNRISSIDTAGGDGSHSEMRVTENQLDAR